MTIITKNKLLPTTIRYKVKAETTNKNHKEIKDIRVKTRQSKRRGTRLHHLNRSHQLEKLKENDYTGKSRSITDNRESKRQRSIINRGNNNQVTQLRELTLDPN